MVGGSVAVLVVDAFEVVDVDGQQGVAGRGPTGTTRCASWSCRWRRLQTPVRGAVPRLGSRTDFVEAHAPTDAARQAGVHKIVTGMMKRLTRRRGGGRRGGLDLHG